MVEITKISMGGTNTAVGAQIFEYELLPEAARNPDIVLNAYSTNDMHILTILEAESGNQTLRDRVFEITQEFVRVVLEKRPCQTHQPLLLHMDDYLGNEQREIWATTELSQGVSVLAHYYGFASMSYANIVRQWVYGDTRETWFSPEGWYNGKKNRDGTRDSSRNGNAHYSHMGSSVQSIESRDYLLQSRAVACGDIAGLNGLFEIVVSRDDSIDWIQVGSFQANQRFHHRLFLHYLHESLVLKQSVVIGKLPMNFSDPAWNQ